MDELHDTTNLVPGAPPIGDGDPGQRVLNWRSLLLAAPAGMFLAQEGKFVFVNDRLAQMFGYPVADMCRHVSSLELATPEYRATVLSHVGFRQVDVVEEPYDIQCQRSDGSRFYARVSAVRVTLPDGQQGDLVAVVDISETVRTMAEARAQALRLTQSDQALQLSQFMLEHSPVPIVAIGTDGRLRYVNESTASMLGWSCEQLLTMTIFDIAPHRHPDMWASNFSTLKQVSPSTFSSDWYRSDGRKLSVELTASHQEHGGDDYIVVYARDTSFQDEAREQALRVSHYDAATGLPNRHLLHERLNSECRLAAVADRRVAVLVVEIREVRQINESWGYEVGDQLLLTLTRRMSQGLHESDILAHLGAGEFVFVVSHDGDVGEEAALELSRLILSVLIPPIRLAQQDFNVTCNIGIVIFPQDTDEPDHVLRKAQAAMRMAQATGPNQICFYTPEANARVGERLALELALRSAVERQELYLQYQPQVDLLSGQVIGVEALVRWRHPQLGDVSPVDFIPLAEQTGVIVSIGAWVLKTACEAAVRWKQAGLPALRMAVNLSRRQLEQPDLACAIETTLIHAGLDPHCLTVEVAEGVLIENIEATSRTLCELKSIGIGIALDDFGTACSSLPNLRRLPIDVIKIDRSLVPDITAATQDVSITRAIINMAHSMQMKVLAVGVECEGELALLVANQCDLIQGYFFSAPLHEDDLMVLLRQKKCLPKEMLSRKGRSRTLLIVDDEENIVSSLKRLLRRDGYHIVTANSGLQGLQRLAEHDVDVIISDQRMPGMTGVEFLRRAKELYPHTVRIVLSGYTELQSITDAINEGAIYKFLTKPWDDERVRVHIHEAFSQKEMADENLRLDREVQDANRELADVNSRLNAVLASQRAQILREETSLINTREVIENIPAPVLGIDEFGMIAFMNSDAEQMFDEAGAWLGMHVNDIGCQPLAELWIENKGCYRDVYVHGRAFRAICRAMKGKAQYRGSLMVLTPRTYDHGGAVDPVI